MARKKEPDKGPSQAYLISFGDTMTTLLAFFIVLCSMAEDQTGANLYSGNGLVPRRCQRYRASWNVFAKQIGTRHANAGDEPTVHGRYPRRCRA